MRVCISPDPNGNLKEGNAILSLRGETEHRGPWGGFATHPSWLQMERTHGWKLWEHQGDTDPEQGLQLSGLGKMALPNGHGDFLPEFQLTQSWMLPYKPVLD